MSRLPHIDLLLSAFCDGSETNVLMLKGEWGSGKTYFVAKYFKDHPPTQYKYVSFVSLFGAKSIRGVRKQILANALTKKELSGNQSKSRLRRVIGLSSKLPSVDKFLGFFGSVRDDQTKDLIVVFDDVERKLPQLSLKEVLGFASILSEQLDCKVLMILNEEELETEDQDELKLFREKIFDQEILFKPSLEENARLFFKDAGLFEYALSVFENCETRNLRVIKKCYNHTSFVRSKLGSLGKPILEVILERTVLLACLYYSKANEVDFDRLSDYGYSRIFEKDEDKVPSATKLLSKLNFEPASYDKYIVEYLQTGTLNQNALTETVKQDAEVLEKQKNTAALREIYSIVFSNFTGSKEVFIKKLASYFEKNAANLSFQDIETARDTLKGLGYAEDTSKWVDRFVISHAPALSYRDCIYFKKSHISAEALSAIETRLTAFYGRTPAEILTEMVKTHGWNQEDTDTLNRYTEDDYYTWISTSTNERLFTLLRYALQTFPPDKVQGNPPEYPEIGKKVVGALKRIWTTSDFRRYQIMNHVAGTEQLLRWGFDL